MKLALRTPLSRSALIAGVSAAAILGLAGSASAATVTATQISPTSVQVTQSSPDFRYNSASPDLTQAIDVTKLSMGYSSTSGLVVWTMEATSSWNNHSTFSVNGEVDGLNASGNGPKSASISLQRTSAGTALAVNSIANSTGASTHCFGQLLSLSGGALQVSFPASCLGGSASAAFAPYGGYPGPGWETANVNTTVPDPTTGYGTAAVDEVIEYAPSGSQVTVKLP